MYLNETYRYVRIDKSIQNSLKERMLYHQYFHAIISVQVKEEGFELNGTLSVLTMLIYFENINTIKQTDGQIGV
jgi:hypothetical protein